MTFYDDLKFRKHPYLPGLKQAHWQNHSVITLPEYLEEKYEILPPDSDHPVRCMTLEHVVDYFNGRM